MFKKNIWIVGLLALAIMFAGCVDAFVEDNSGVETEVFNLQETIKDAEVGVLDNDGWTALFKDTPFMMCGGDVGQFSIINEGGVKKVKVDKMTASWGVGLDLYQNAKADSCVGANFKAGDTLSIKGKSVGGLVANANTSGERRLGNKDLDGDFDETFTLSADDVSAIKGGNPPSLRIHYKASAPNGRQNPIIIEQIVLTGKRGGDVEPPPDYSIKGSGNYKTPTSGGYDIYIDLNQAVIFTNAPIGKFPVAEIKKPSGTTGAKDEKTGKITVKFDTNTQGIFIPFDEDVLPIMVNAAQNGYSFDIYIDGVLDVYSASTNQLRYGLAGNVGSNWDVSNLLTVNDATTNINAAKNLTISNGNALRISYMNGIVVQARPGGMQYDSTTGAPTGVNQYNNDPTPIYEGTAATASKLTYTLTIYSIKITPKPPASVTAITSSEITFNLGAPRAGALADKTIVDNVASGNKKFDGVVTWIPALPKDGKFVKGTTYSAKIALTARPGYSLPQTATPVVTPVDKVGVTTIISTYAPYTVSTANFPTTLTVNELKAGVLYKLSDTFKDKNGKELGSPLQNAGVTPKYGMLDGTIPTSGNAEGIIVTGATANWHGFDIVLSKVDAGIDPAVNKIKVVVTGKVLALPDGATLPGQMRVASAGSPYTNPPASGYDNYSASNLAANSTFTMTINEIRSDYVALGNQGSLRICGNVSDDGASPTPNPTTCIPSSFIITEITITNEGNR